jgi:hypothetical protein
VNVHVTLSFLLICGSFVVPQYTFAIPDSTNSLHPALLRRQHLANPHNTSTISSHLAPSSILAFFQSSSSHEARIEKTKETRLYASSSHGSLEKSQTWMPNLSIWWLNCSVLWPSVLRRPSSSAYIPCFTGWRNSVNSVTISLNAHPQCCEFVTKEIRRGYCRWCAGKVRLVSVRWRNFTSCFCVERSFRFPLDDMTLYMFLGKALIENTSVGDGYMHQEYASWRKLEE